MEERINNRIKELAERSYSENRFLFTDFLDMSQLSIFYGMEKDLSYVGTCVSGGAEGCERCIVRFGSPELFGYDESFPIVLLRISPVMKKFADILTHRDFLGSVIGLGIERSKLGDILVRDNEGYIFVMDTISEYIVENLSSVKHTSVKVSVCDDIPEALSPKFLEESIIVSSNRLDAIIAKVFNLSRNAALNLISEGKVFVCGRQETGNAKTLKDGDVVSVRGKGKFIFSGEGGNTKKDKLYIEVKKYI